MIDDYDVNEMEGEEGGDGTEVTLTELLEETIVQALQAMAGPIIGKVNSYDASTARASITPLVPLLVEGELVPSPTLPSVPVAFPRSATHAYTFPLGTGSYMELIPLGHDHSRWLVSATEGQAPSDDRRFSLADLVALPLVPSPLSAPPDPLSYDSAWAVLFGQHKVGDNTANDFVALASLVKAQLDSIQLAYDTHSHPTAPTGPTSPPSNIIGTIGNVACTTLKAK